MADRINFTKKVLESLTIPAGKDRLVVYDVKVPALSLVVRGNKTFYTYRRFQGRPRRIRLGEFPEITVEQARTAAEEKLGQRAQGIDPSDERRRARDSWTLVELLNHYIDTHGKLHKKTWEDDRAQFERYFGKAGDDEVPPCPGWRTRKASSITCDDVTDLHAKIGTKHGKYAANRVLALLSSIFNHAKLPNPCDGVRKFKEKSRDRFLLPNELPRFYKALKEEPNETIRDFILMALFTGARRGNVQAMRWDEVNVEAGTWRIPETKSGDAVTVHLPTPALQILEARLAAQQAKHAAQLSKGEISEDAEPCPWVFPGPPRIADYNDLSTTYQPTPGAAWTLCESQHLPHYS